MVQSAFLRESPPSTAKIVAELWLTRHQNASESLTIRAGKNAANRLPNLKFIGYYGKSWSDRICFRKPRVTSSNLVVGSTFLQRGDRRDHPPSKNLSTI